MTKFGISLSEYGLNMTDFVITHLDLDVLKCTEKGEAWEDTLFISRRLSSQFQLLLKSVVKFYAISEQLSGIRCWREALFRNPLAVSLRQPAVLTSTSLWCELYHYQPASTSLYRSSRCSTSIAITEKAFTFPCSTLKCKYINYNIHIQIH